MTKNQARQQGKVTVRVPAPMVDEFVKAAKEQGRTPSEHAKTLLLAAINHDAEIAARFEVLEEELGTLQEEFDELRQDLRELAFLLLFDRHRNLPKDEVRQYVEDALGPGEWR